MTAVQPKQELSRTAIARYWARVRVTMTSIFKLPRTQAIQRVASLRAMQDEMEGDQAIAGYHIEPLRVAADLAGKEISSSHVRQYRQLAAGTLKAPAAPASSAKKTGRKEMVAVNKPQPVPAKKPVLRKPRAIKKPAQASPPGEGNFAFEKAV